MNANPIRRPAIALLAAAAWLPPTAPGQVPVTLANPHWNITLTEVTLEESLNLSGWAASSRTITTLDGQRSLTISTSEGRVFFRLKYQ